MPQHDEEDFEVRKTAWIAFKSSAIAGFQAQKPKYSSVEQYAAEVDEFSNAVADESMRSYLERANEGFEFEERESDEDEDEEEEEDEDDDRPRRAKRKSR